MRFLHTSDWHLGKSLYEFSLLEDQEHFLRWLLRVIAEEGIEAVLIAGDIYDRPIPPAEAIRLFDSFLMEAVTRLKVPVLAIAGNHDSGARLEFASGLLGESGYHIAGQAQKDIRRVTLKDAHGPVDFRLLPWLFPADARSLMPDAGIKSFSDAYHALIGAMGTEPDRRSVCLSHGFFTGREKTAILSDSEVSVGGMDAVDSAIFSPFRYVALGHLHAPQEAGADHIRYSGSPLKYSLSEEFQRKSVSIVDMDGGGQVKMSEIPVPALRDVRAVRGSFAQLMDVTYHQNRAFEDYVLAEVTDFGALHPMEKLRRLFPRLLRIQFLGQEEEPVIFATRENPEKYTVEDHFGRFYAAVKGQEMDEAKMALLREILEKTRRAGEVSR